MGTVGDMGTSDDLRPPQFVRIACTVLLRPRDELHSLPFVAVNGEPPIQDVLMCFGFSGALANWRQNYLRDGDVYPPRPVHDKGSEL